MIEPQTPYQTGTRPAPEMATSVLAQSFGWMFAGLLLTSAIAWFVAGNTRIIDTVAVAAGPDDADPVEPLG